MEEEKTSEELDNPGVTHTSSGIAFDIDSEKKIRVLLVSNKGDIKPGTQSKPDLRGKSCGVGFPTGGRQTCETNIGALEREYEDESGFRVGSVVWHLGDIPKRDKQRRVVNIIHEYLVAVTDMYQVDIREKSEISKAEWMLLRDVFLAPNADWDHPEGVYLSHKRRLAEVSRQLYNMSDDELVKMPEAFQEWYIPIQEVLEKEMDELIKDGILPLKNPPMNSRRTRLRSHDRYAVRV